jgi:hypothetical protein
MDYRYLRQQLMKTFQQLVIFDIKEVSFSEVELLMDKALIYDLTDKTKNDQPKKYYLGSYNYKPLIVILDDISTHDQYNDYLSTIYNLYGAIVRNHKTTVTFDEMNISTNELTESDQTLHWIWFREKDFCLPDKIMSRAKSWVELNHSFKFYLWTNLLDEDELDDFLSSLNESNRAYFTDGKIIVKYQHDIMANINEFCQKYGALLDSGAENTLNHIFNVVPPVTTATKRAITTSTHTTATTIIETVTQNNYKINRIFRVDILRVILLVLYGGIYSDFNDTICFYPMKYLLPMYKNEYFVGTDYDIEHPVYRNNYFIYNSLQDSDFVDLSMKCVNKALKEYVRITHPDFIKEYYELSLEFLSLLNQSSIDMRGDICLVPILLQASKLKKIIDDDNLKDPSRIINLVAEIYTYFGQESDSLKQLSQRIIHEIDNLDANWLRTYKIRQKNSRRRRHLMADLVFPIVYDQSKMDNLSTNYEFYDYFLMKYAIIMTIGDLILSTNISYIGEMKNLVPYARSNRLSTISMITHIYDGTSYGLSKNYDTLVSGEIDLRREFL